ncbi:hypothetical protein V6N11_044384 [Hibiscus sabdariffa]|uniref:Uncharacterized protein n=1 Tax=Hibiscus sabdariffa TaxID=183260 RepID=A0ABR2RF73_9ROSI
MFPGVPFWVGTIQALHILVLIGGDLNSVKTIEESEGYPFIKRWRKPFGHQSQSQHVPHIVAHPWIYQRALPRGLSNQNPILLSEEVSSGGLDRSNFSLTGLRSLILSTLLTVLQRIDATNMLRVIKTVVKA